jgi:hypothetical protein
MSFNYESFNVFEFDHTSFNVDYKGNKRWFKNGELHREDGPALECPDGFKAWYQNGKLHREDGPAIEFTNGQKEWYINGCRHRTDGPAIEYSFGIKMWYLNGVRQKIHNKINYNWMKEGF